MQWLITNSVFQRMYLLRVNRSVLFRDFLHDDRSTTSRSRGVRLYHLAGSTTMLDTLAFPRGTELAYINPIAHWKEGNFSFQ